MESDQPKTPKDRTVEVFIVCVSALEVIVLYILLAVQTPLSDWAHGMVEDVIGLVILVFLLATILGFIVLSCLTGIRKLRRTRSSRRAV